MRILWARLEHKLSRQGAIGSTIVLSALAVAMAALVRLMLYFDGASLTRTAFFHLVIETVAVASPLILYSRYVIAQLKKSRRQLAEMSCHLAVAVDEAEQASRAKSAFLANMSHELRTPLNAILGFSEVMKEQSLGAMNNPRYLAYVAHIHDSGQHLLGIINDVLDLAKIEAGKMTLDNATQFALEPLVSSVIAMLKSLGEKFHVTVHNQMAEPDLHFTGVERMVRQIVINLVGNAIKFTPAEGEVTISGHKRSDGGYDIMIRDTGIGMNEEELARALKPFGQNGNRFTGRQDGTGLGLPLAKAMLELHGGTLTLASTPEMGTTVTMGLPPGRVNFKGKAAA
jgi:signal transduction histidine kinase